MAEVSIAISGRSYALHCRDGEEARLHQLARMIGERVDKVKAGSPGLTEVRLLLFAALLLADDLSDAQSAPSPAMASPAEPAPSDDAVPAHVLERLAERLEGLGDALAAAATPA